MSSIEPEVHNIAMPPERITKPWPLVIDIDNAVKLSLDLWL